MASAYLTKTLSGSPTDKNKWTFSAWIKKTGLGKEQIIIFADDGSTNYLTNLRFNDQDEINFQNRWAGSNDMYLITTEKYRDPSAWLHIVAVFDTSNATQADRQIIYVNGTRLDNYRTETQSSLDRNSSINDGYTHNIGVGVNSQNTDYFDGSMTHIHFTDGYAYSASDFGETDSTSGIWKPKTSPSVSYGTNGFFLDMADSSALGDDESGNTNDFTVGGTITQTEDSPSNNFATMNPLAMGTASSNHTFSNGNLTSTNSSSAHRSVVSSLAVSSGKWYFEGKSVTTGGAYPTFGIFNADAPFDAGTYFTSTANGYGYNSNGAIFNNNGSIVTGLATWTDGDIIGVALDVDNDKIYFSKNGSWQNSADPSAGTGGQSITSDITWYFAGHTNDGGTDPVQNYNFGNGRFGTTALASSNSDSAGLGLFEYSVPSGYYALCTKNIKNYG